MCRRRTAASGFLACGNIRPSARTPLQETGPPTPLLDTINFPVHLKNLGINDLKKLSKELRAGA